MTEGGWDRPHNPARTFGERDGNDEPLAEGNDDNDDEYGEDGNIPDDNNNDYAVGVDGVDEPLDKGNKECDTLSAAPAQAGLTADVAEWLD
jgi:hypothetical protein